MKKNEFLEWVAKMMGKRANATPIYSTLLIPLKKKAVYRIRIKKHDTQRPATLGFEKLRHTEPMV